MAIHSAPTGCSSHIRLLSEGEHTPQGRVHNRGRSTTTSSPLGRFVVRSPQSLLCSRPTGCVPPERCATKTSRLYYTGRWVGLVKTINIPARMSRLLFAGFEWECSSRHEEAAVVEQAGKVSRRSESNKSCRAGTLGRRLQSVVGLWTTVRIPGLRVL